MANDADGAAAAGAVDGPRTHQRGPSDPATLADGPGTWVEATIAAPVEAVWALVTDVDLPARFSSEFQGGRWTGEGPALGASFIGRNRHPQIGEWEVESWVDVFEEGRAFGWATVDRDDPGSRWRFRLRSDDEGTRLRYEVILGPGPSGLTAAIAARPADEARLIDGRLTQLYRNMVRTVEGIKQVAEAASTTSAPFET